MTTPNAKNIFSLSQEKKYESVYFENVTPSKVDTLNNSIHSQTLEGLDFILRHLDGYSFPRNIMTQRLSRQIEVWDEDAAIREFELSDWQDCRISSYPTFTKYKGLNFTAASIVFIDLDLQHFKSQQALDRALKKTLGLIQKVVARACPTVLWTGNGYHIYLPINGFVLEQEQIFADFIKSAGDPNPYLDPDLTTKFMRFAEQYFTNNRHDPNHKPSVNNCLLRIPGTYNSRNGQQVRIVQEWNGYKAPIQYMLREFRRYLIQERIDNNRYQQQRPPVNSSFSNQRSGSNYGSGSGSGSLGSIGWIEDLLKTPIADQRKYCIWRILAPYLVNCKHLNNEHTYDIIGSWLDQCSKLERLSFYPKPRISDDIRRARRFGYYPISLSNLQKDNPELYHNIIQNGNGSHS